MLRVELLENNLQLLGEGCSFPLRSFQECRGGMSGPVFLLASGASSKTFPAPDYKRFPFIAMNGSISRCLDEGITPEFYICDDPNFVKGRPDLALLGVSLAKNLAMTVEVLSEIYECDPASLVGRNIYLLHRASRPPIGPQLDDRRFAWSVRGDKDFVVNFSFFRKKKNRIGFSKNLAKGYFNSRTIPFAALQLAYHLGFDLVFIVGMDLNPAVGRFYEEAGRGLPTSLDEHYESYIKPSFEIMSHGVCDERFSVYNLSVNSRLPSSVVPKIGVDDLADLLRFK